LLLDVTELLSRCKEVLVVLLVVVVDEAARGRFACVAKAWEARNSHRNTMPRNRKLQRADFMAAIADARIE
jgi:hypothetical protein